MTDNKAARSTIAYLILCDQAHENAYAEALESLGVNWRPVLPTRKTNDAQFPEVKKLLDLGLQSIHDTFNAAQTSQAAKLYRGTSPSNDGTELSTAIMPEGPRPPLRPSARRSSPPARLRAPRPHPGHRQGRDHGSIQRRLTASSRPTHPHP